MNNKPDGFTDYGELRRQAEAKYNRQTFQENLPPNEIDLHKLIQELQIHQIELEMQYEELKQARSEVEAGLERYTDLYDFAPVGYFTLSPEGVVSQVNLCGARLLGIDRSQLVDRPFALFVEDDDRSVFKVFLKNVFENRSIQTCELSLNQEKYCPTRERTYTQTTGQATQIIVQIEATTGKDGLTCRAMVIDITERRRNEEALRGLLEISHILASPVGFLPGLILDQMRKIVNYSSGSFFVLEDAALVTLAMRGNPQIENSAPIRVSLPEPEAVAQWLKESRPIRIANVWGDDADARTLRSLLKDRGSVLLEGIQSWMWVPLAVRGRLTGIVGMAQTRNNYFSIHHADVALSVANQAAIAMSNAELYHRAQELAALEERQSLARNLHDAINQSLFSAGLIAEVLPRLWDQDQADARLSLEDLRRLLRGVQAEMRTLLAELRPSTLTDSSLGDLLRVLGNAFSGRTNIPIDFIFSEDFILPAAVQETFYRVCQEALLNVAKHAHASKVEIYLKQGEAEVKMRIHDDGRGFDPRTNAPGHYGLKMMRERGESVSALLSISSQPGHGTELTLSWTKPSFGEGV
jgi:PAS domain S-box-containing protein